MSLDSTSSRWLWYVFARQFDTSAVTNSSGNHCCPAGPARVRWQIRLGNPRHTPWVQSSMQFAIWRRAVDWRSGRVLHSVALRHSCGACVGATGIHFCGWLRSASWPPSSSSPGRGRRMRQAQFRMPVRRPPPGPRPRPPPLRARTPRQDRRHRSRVACRPMHPRRRTHRRQPVGPG